MKHLFLAVLAVLFLCSAGYAECPIKEGYPGWCLSAYFQEDLNNDGKKEIIKVISPCFFYTNMDDSFWGDDTGIVIVFFDDQGKEISWDEVVRDQSIENIEVGDFDQDGFKEIAISVEAGLYSEARTFVYGWKEGAFQRVEGK